MSKRLLHVILTLIVGFIFVFGNTIILCAQESATDEFTLEEITVTAQKRVENQQKVAISMEVITGDELASSGKSNIDDILSNTANAIFLKSSDGVRVSLRGLAETEGTFNDLHASTPTVAINVDGAYNSSSSAGQNLFDVERVEVLYGPQSTMYASNSPGGIVNVITVAPKLDKYSAQGSIEIGNYNLINSQVAVNIPIINEMLGMRIAGSQTKRDTHISNSDDVGEDTKKVRLKTLYQPNDKLSATVTLNWSQSGNGGMSNEDVKVFDRQDGYWGTLSGNTWVQDAKVTDPWTAPDETTGGGGPGGATGPNSAKSTTKGMSGEIAWDAGIGSLTIVPQYSKTTSNDSGDLTGTDTDGNSYTYIAYTDMDSWQKGVEARMTSSADFTFKWILGANFYKSYSRRLTTYSDDDDYALNNVTETNKAVFGNITYPFKENFRGTAGVRMSWDKQGNIEYPARTGYSGISGQEYNKPDYKVGFEYDLAPNSMLYVDRSTSYKVNAMSVQEGKDVKAEQLVAYTIGSKNRFLSNKLQVNASAYYYDYKNKGVALGDARLTDDIAENTVTHNGVQVGDINGDGVVNADSISNLTDPYQQTGKFRIIGVDMSTDWIMTISDKLSLSVSYMNSNWYDLKAEYYYDVFKDLEYDYSGKEAAMTPKWTVNASYEHNFILGEYGLLVPHVDVQYKSSYYLQLDYNNSNYPYDLQEAYYTANASSTYTSPSGMWTLNGYIKNILNYAAKTMWNNMGATKSLGISDPRTFGAVFSVKF
jgi:iron complex outermembrane recepter protein